MPYSDPQKQRDAAKAHYQANKATYKKRARAWNREQQKKLRNYIREYLLSHPCVDCGESDPIVLEFDHRDGTDKKFAIGNISGQGIGLKTLEREIAKCDVRCANCHRRRTAHQLGWWIATEIAF